MKKSLTWIYIDFTLSGSGIKVTTGTLFHHKCSVIEASDITIWPRCSRIGMNTIWQTSTTRQSFGTWFTRNISLKTNVLLIFTGCHRDLSTITFYFIKVFTSSWRNVIEFRIGTLQFVFTKPCCASGAVNIQSTVQWVSYYICRLVVTII